MNRPYYNYNYGVTSCEVQAKFWEMRDRLIACGWNVYKPTTEYLRRPYYFSPSIGRAVVYKATRWHKYKWRVINIILTITDDVKLSIRKDSEQSVVIASVTAKPIKQEYAKDWCIETKWAYLSLHGAH